MHRNFGRASKRWELYGSISQLLGPHSIYSSWATRQMNMNDARIPHTAFFCQACLLLFIMIIGRNSPQGFWGRKFRVYSFLISVFGFGCLCKKSTGDKHSQSNAGMTIPVDELQAKTHNSVCGGGTCLWGKCSSFHCFAWLGYSNWCKPFALCS